MLIRVPVQFRLAREDDLAALEWMGLFTRQRAIIAEAFEAQQDGRGAMLLAIANDFPIGQVWIDFDRETPRFWAVRVFPPLQGVGLGTRLIEEAEACAAARGHEAVELGVEWDNRGAQRFYRRLGYAPVGAEREEVDYTHDDYPMTMVVDQEILRKELEP